MRARHGLLNGLRRLLAGVLMAFTLVSLPLHANDARAQEDNTPRSSSVSIRTPDFDDTLRWYEDKLGFRLIANRSLVAGRTAVMERSGFLLEIAEADHPPVSSPDTDAQNRPRATGFPVISLLVPDVDKEVSRLRKMGVEVLQDPQDELDGRYRAAQIRDNGRHRIELREPLGDDFYATGR